MRKPRNCTRRTRGESAWANQRISARIPDNFLRTTVAKIDQRRNAADETELIWRKGGRGGKKESERIESKVDRKRKESLRHEDGKYM